MFLENQDFGVFLIKTQRHRGAENFLFYEHRRHERMRKPLQSAVVFNSEAHFLQPWLNNRQRLGMRHYVG